MYKDGTLQLSEWTKGMADSPLQGFANIANAEVFESPGVLKIANRTTDASGGTTYAGLCVAQVVDIYGNTYQLTSDGKVYKNYSTVIQSGLGTVWDLLIFKDYLWVRHSTVISLYGPLSTAPSWSGNVYNGLSSGYYGKMVQDENPDGSLGSEAVYVCNGNTIATIRSFVSVASPGSLTLSALTLPDGIYATTMVSVGNNLMIGTQKGGSWVDGTNFKLANIYSWDKVITNSYNLPVKINESTVQAMISDGNKLYVVAGTRGNLYITDTTNYAKIKRIPWVQLRGFNQTLRVYPNAINFNNNGNLIIGTSTLTDSFNTGINSSRHGIWEVGILSKYPVVFKNQISAGTTGSTTTLKIGSIYSGADDSIYIGWQSGSTYGIDKTDFRAYTSYATFAESPLIVVGTRINPKTFKNLEFMLLQPLIATQGLKISYRKNLTDDYTLIGTFDFSTLGGVQSHNSKALIESAEILQIKVELTQSISVTVGNNVNLLSIKIW